MTDSLGDDPGHSASRNEARQRIDAYLDSLEQALAAAGGSRERRRAIADDVEAQIVEMLRPTDPSVATVAEVDAVLKRLDPPSAYTTPAPDSVASTESASLPPPSAAPPARLCLQALRASLECGFGLLVTVCFGAAFFIHAPVQVGWRAGLPVDSGVFVPAGWLVAIALIGIIAGTVDGWRALAKLHRSAGRLYGTALAVFAACVGPVVVMVILSFVAWNLAVFVYYVGYCNNAYIPDRGVPIVMIGGGLTACVLSWLLVRAALLYGRNEESLPPSRGYVLDPKLA